MPHLINQAQPALEFIPPALNPLVLCGCQQLLPLWLRFQTRVTDIQAENVGTLVTLYRQFQERKIRFLLAFRHPGGDDPFCLAHFLWRAVPQVARQKNVSLQTPIHAHFMYDRGIPLWAGSFVGWINSRLGATPIQRGKADRQGLRAARDLFANGCFPLAASPEGSKNGHNEIVSPLEPGIAQLGFWCAEDLLKAGRTEQVLIVPVGIEYHYVEEPWKALEKLLSQLEADLGLPVGEGAQNRLPQEPTPAQHSLYLRLYRLGERLLCLMEEFYCRFYHQSLPQVPAEGDRTPDLSARLQALLNVALNVAEQYFGVTPKGGVIDRCRRLEQAGWDWIYREDIKDIDTIPAGERGLADRIAEEASLRMWHIRLVENFVAVTGNYVREKPTAERFAETALLLWDTLTRIKGQHPFPRPRIGEQRVKLTVGEPISVSDRWANYQASRRSAIAALTQDLQTALEAMIV
ncbi:1-acyl-sn-glycerol-3-phosphate acyltransferase [Kamptonema formosum]|uniref:1-acyl-sn-glycerol-3-phosphate acyltransferase n=1 Tax=Kamptonema formosum TaxID=331992 RepID=UPI0003767635|nr:1-acyl-sn-glycerol-3-phosphate acyltransferase [Oscillatoria sp. PCC 10802]